VGDLSKSLMKIALRIIIVAVAILISDFIGLGLYSLLTSREALSNLWLVLVIEGGAMMLFGVLGTTTLPQRGTIGFPWSQSVRAASQEIRRDRPKQVDFWIQFGIVGFILFIIGLLLTTSF